MNGKTDCIQRLGTITGQGIEIAAHGYVLTPGRYVGAEQVEDDDEPFDEKMHRLTSTLREQFEESARLGKAIAANLKGLGFDI